MLFNGAKGIYNYSSFTSMQFLFTAFKWVTSLQLALAIHFCHRQRPTNRDHCIILSEFRISVRIVWHVVPWDYIFPSNLSMLTNTLDRRMREIMWIMFSIQIFFFKKHILHPNSNRVFYLNVGKNCNAVDLYVQEKICTKSVFWPATNYQWVGSTTPHPTIRPLPPCLN